jgi:hypothetical protein
MKGACVHEIDKIYEYTEANSAYNPYVFTAPTPAERKRKQRERDKAQGLIRRDVKAHPDDWAEIRALELRLKNKRLTT